MRSVIGKEKLFV